MLLEKTFGFGKTVFSEGDEAEHIFLIKDGQFEVTKDLFVKEIDKVRQIGFRRMYTARGEQIHYFLFRNNFEHLDDKYL